MRHGPRRRTATAAALVFAAAAAVAPVRAGINFPYEAVQLTSADVAAFPAVAFGNASAAAAAAPPCRAFPGSVDWPAPATWARLNATLDGALLHPTPLGAVCYPRTTDGRLGPAAGIDLYNATACRALVFGALGSRVYLDDPLAVLTRWPQGATCAATLAPPRGRACARGGFPAYVVNVSSVRHVQAAVNFARRQNLRLVVKNTGHDFVGRSTGAGALSVWTHHLKSFAFLPRYAAVDPRSGRPYYRGMAARVGAGLEAWELYAYMARYNMTLVVPGGQTVGAYGGWIAGGGHSALGSLYGMGADQVLSLQVVTADGRFVTANATHHPDLFYALRGGGPGSYGIVTSAVVRAFPPLHVAERTIAFQVGRPFWAGLNSTGLNTTGLNTTGPFPPPLGTGTGTANATHPALNWTVPPLPPPVVAPSLAAFWQGVAAYFRFGETLCDHGGTGYSYITQLAPDGSSVAFSATLELPGMTLAAARAFLQPVVDSLRRLGIPVHDALPHTSTQWSPGWQHGQGDSPGDTRFATRLFPRRNWHADAVFNATMDAVRAVVHAGYPFHGVQVAPSRRLPAAQFPGNNSVNPAFRDALMQGDVFDMAAGAFFGGGGGGGSGANGTSAAARAQQAAAAHARFDAAVDRLRAVTPGSGAYVNEADPDEPDWQQSFWGDEYGRLLAIQRAYDPWNVFWAPTTVGSEGWSVRAFESRYAGSQNGRLCQVSAPAGAEDLEPGAVHRRPPAFTGPRHA